MKFLFLFFLACTFQNIQAQQTTGKSKSIPMPIINPSINNNWHIKIQSEAQDVKHYPSFTSVQQIKNYWASLKSSSKNIPIKNTRGNAPKVGKNFLGNKLEFVSPTDNAIAISNGGQIVSADNWTMVYADTNGVLQDTMTWADFVSGDTTLTGSFMYDPRVIYDNIADRFIVLILANPLNDKKNKVILGFSKTNKPANGWNLYALSGNPFNKDSTWSDYPNAGINNGELFITLNSLTNYPPYDYNNHYIYQINTADGYTGNALLGNKVWYDIFALDNYPGFTLVPVPEGMGNHANKGMHFVQTRPDTGTQVYHYYIDNKFNTTANLLRQTYTMPKFYVCSDGYFKDPITNIKDSISTGAAWVQNGFILDSIIHFTFSANIDTGWCGINYARLNLKTGNVALKQFGNKYTHLSYPAIASMAHTIKDKSAAIVFLKADINTLPQAGAFTVDDNMGLSSPVIIKAGDTTLNLTYPPYGFVERWGDYSGIQRKYNDSIPTTWLAAAYSGNNPGRKAGFNTWIAQLISKDTFVSTPVGLKTNYVAKAQISPNPIDNYFKLSFFNAKAQNLVATIYNAQGALVKTLLNAFTPYGEINLSFNKGALPSGVYYFKLNSTVLLYQSKLIIK